MICGTHDGVTNQAGIYTGTDGYDITVKDNTTLTGSVIDSTAIPGKNNLTTGSLTMKDIENKASNEDAYSSIGFTYDKTFKDIEKTVTDRGYVTAEEKEYLDKNYNKVGLVPDLGMSSKESASSMTKSAIAPGKLTVTKEPVNLNTINRDTKNSLNELGKIFDKKKLEERQELAKLFAKNADEAIHQISESKGWENGSKEKIALHTLVGGITAELGGHSFVDGGFVGGVNEAVVGKLMDAIGKDKPDMVQIASAVLGYATNKLAGKDGEAAENDFIYSFNQAAEIVGIWHRYDAELGMTNNLRIFLQQSADLYPDRDMVYATGKLGVGFGSSGTVGVLGVQVSANSHAEWSTNESHPKIVTEATLGAKVLNTVGAWVNPKNVYTPVNHQSENKFGGGVGYKKGGIGLENNDVILNLGFEGYLGAGGGGYINFNLSKALNEAKSAVTGNETEKTEKEKILELIGE